MKKLLLIAVLLSALPVVSHAKIVAIPQKMKALKWPTFRQTAARKSTPEIKAIQYLLRSRGFYTQKIDGVFGAQTTKSVRAFQLKNGLKVDGIVAAQTFPKLIQTLKRGDKGDAVRAFQTLLQDAASPYDGPGAYADLKVDGTFGFQSESYLRSYQSDVRDLDEKPFFKADGVVGNLTWCELFGGQI